MKRCIYAFDSADVARMSIPTLVNAGIPEQDISLMAKTDIQANRIPHRFLDASTDFAPALARGAAIGGVTGLVAGLIVTSIPAFGFDSGSLVMLAFLVIGILVGGWSSALMGSALSDEVRQKFDDEIEAGRTLLVIDVKKSQVPKIHQLMAERSDSHVVWQSDMTIPVV